jgi:uncharacterized protein
MARPVVHFEIIGTDPHELRGYYAELFGWSFDVGNAAEQVSQPGNYGFVQPDGGIPGGIGGGAGFTPRTLFYVGVDDVEQALRDAERLGGTRVSGPHRHPDAPLSVGFFTDPQGHLVGVAASH